MKRFLLPCCLAALVSLMPAQENPFFSGNPAAPRQESAGLDADAEPEAVMTGEDAAPAEPEKTAAVPAGSGRSGSFLSDLQRTLHEGISGFLRRSSEGSVSAWLLIIGLSFLYGVVHAAGPGHRKTIVFSYFLAENARWYHGVGVGMGLGILHAGSALVIILSVYWIVRTSLMHAFENINIVLQSVSAYALVGFGAIILILKLRDLYRFILSGHVHPRDHAVPADGRSMIPFILFSGLIPCPGASLIMIFALSLGAAAAGIVAVLSLSAGIGLTVSAVAVLTIVLRDRMLRLLERKNGLREWIHLTVEGAGAAGILLMGLLLAPA